MNATLTPDPVLADLIDITGVPVTQIHRHGGCGVLAEAYVENVRPASDSDLLAGLAECSECDRFRPAPLTETIQRRDGNGEGRAAKRPALPATEKQVRFLTALVRSKVAADFAGDTGLEQVVTDAVAEMATSKKAASKAIDEHLTAGYKPVWNPLTDAPAAPAPTRTAEPEATGYEPEVDSIHYVDGRYVKVRRARAGHLYVLVYNDASGKFEYEQGTGRLVRSLSPATVIDAERAAQFGHDTGSCVFCMRHLTDDRSVSVGYGPVCADRHGLPWGD